MTNIKEKVLKKVLMDKGVWWINSKKIGKGINKYFTHRLLTDKTEFKEAIEKALNLYSTEVGKLINKISEETHVCDDTCDGDCEKPNAILIKKEKLKELGI